jgi:hypothetical protein
MDPSAQAIAGSIDGVTLTAVSAPGVERRARIGWESQAATAGPGTVYDIVSGSLGALRLTGTFDGALCLASDLPGPPYEDRRAGLPPGAAHYYLVRGRNSCGGGTYGDSSRVPDPRDALDQSSPCP